MKSLEIAKIKAKLHSLKYQRDCLTDRINELERKLSDLRKSED